MFQKDEQVVARKAGGLNPSCYYSYYFAIGFVFIYSFWVTQVTLKMQKIRWSFCCFSDVEGKDIHPESFLGLSTKEGLLYHLDYFHDYSNCFLF
jgi:biopolymer transport protein ExbB